MSTREIASPIQGGVIDAAYNLSNTLLAVQQAGQILVLARQQAVAQVVRRIDGSSFDGARNLPG